MNIVEVMGDTLCLVNTVRYGAINFVNYRGTWSTIYLYRKIAGVWEFDKVMYRANNPDPTDLGGLSYNIFGVTLSKENKAYFIDFGGLYEIH